MQYRMLGKTGLKVSEIGLGASQLGRAEVTDKQAEEVLNLALDLGINFIDTAAMYKFSEERIGRFLAHRKDEFIIATKCGDYSVFEEDGTVRTVKDYTPQGVVKTIDASRKKLNVDTIDLVQFHGLPLDADERKQAMDALVKMKEKHIVRFIGVSMDNTFTEEQFAQWPIDTREFTYNVLEQDSARTIMPILADRQIGTVVKRPIANAVFLMDERPDGTYYGHSWDRAQKVAVGELAGDMSPVEFALRFVLAHPGVNTAIVGTTNPKNLIANAAVSDGPQLDPDLVKKAKELVAQEFAEE